MQEQEIITFLSLMGDELQDAGITQPIRILLIGGAYMLTQIHNRATTQDIDVIVLTPATDSQEYTIFKRIVQFVAQDQGINPA
jgi:response regulator RpfG family c-di-GMP phosphodiesterase